MPENLSTYLPGDAIEMTLELRHASMHLHEAGAAFRHEEYEEYELHAWGAPEATGRQAPLSPHGIGESSVAELVLDVPARALPGVYRVNRAWAETYSGRVYRYEGDALGGMAEFGFEVVEEPDAKPDIRISFAE